MSLAEETLSVFVLDGRANQLLLIGGALLDLERRGEVGKNIFPETVALCYPRQFGDLIDLTPFMPQAWWPELEAIQTTLGPRAKSRSNEALVGRLLELVDPDDNQRTMGSLLLDRWAELSEQGLAKLSGGGDQEFYAAWSEMNAGFGLTMTVLAAWADSGWAPSTGEAQRVFQAHSRHQAIGAVAAQSDRAADALVRWPDLTALDTAAKAWIFPRGQRKIVDQATGHGVNAVGLPPLLEQVASVVLDRAALRSVGNSRCLEKKRAEGRRGRRL